MALLTNFQLSVDSKWHFFLLLLHNTEPWAKAFRILRKEKKRAGAKVASWKKLESSYPIGSMYGIYLHLVDLHGKCS